MAINNLESELGTSCKVQIPNTGDQPELIVPRWSTTGVSIPHAIVTPNTAEDIIKAIKYAAEHKLKVVPINGSHGSFVPITSNVLYLPMSEFKDIRLDQEQGEVTIGGGCVTGEVMKSLAAQGWYTCFPKSNAVGMIGGLIGSLNHSLVGLHGLGIDCIKSISIIPFHMEDGSEPKEIVLDREESETQPGSPRGRLFSALCGAGYGFGVITSIKLMAWRVSELSMTNNQIWSRTIIFPPPALEIAAQVYRSLHPPPPKLSLALLFLRAPPTAPKPGAPMILLTLDYFGPAEEAEKLCEKALNEAVLKYSVNVIAAPKDFTTFNDSVAPLDRRGDVKEFYSSILQEIDEAGITKAFDTWLRFTDSDMASRATSSVLLTRMSREKLSTGNDFFVARDRRHFLQVLAWYRNPGEKSEVDEFGNAVLKAIRAKDESQGRRHWGFPSNLRVGQDVGEVYSDDQIREIKSIKEIWDRNNVGWSPIVDGWP